MKPLKQHRQSPITPDESPKLDSVEIQLETVSIPIEETLMQPQINEPRIEFLKASLGLDINSVTVYDTEIPQNVSISVFNHGRGFVLYPTQRALVPVDNIFDMAISNADLALKHGLTVVGGIVKSSGAYIPIINLSKEKRVIRDGDVIADVFY